MARRLVDLVQVAQHVAHAGVLHLFLEHLAVADHRRQRRAQLVAHVRDELTLGQVGRLGRVLGPLQLNLDHLARCNVGVDADPFENVAVVIHHWRRPARHVAPFAISPAHAMLYLVHTMPRHRVMPHRQRLIAVFRVNSIEPSTAGDLLFGLTGERAPWRGITDQFAVQVRAPDDLRDGFDQRTVAPLLADHLALLLDRLRDVGIGADPANDIALRIA